MAVQCHITKAIFWFVEGRNLDIIRFFSRDVKDSEI